MVRTSLVRDFRSTLGVSDDDDNDNDSNRQHRDAANDGAGIQTQTH